MGNSIGRFGDRHPVPALGFNARVIFSFPADIRRGPSFVAMLERVRYRYSCHAHRISGYRITAVAADLLSFVESV
jgi:hypothetical protein